MIKKLQQLDIPSLNKLELVLATFLGSTKWGFIFLGYRLNLEL
jgi:hypothetical protein